VRNLRTPFSIATIAAVVALLIAGGASGALKSPVPIGPNDDAVVGSMPAFAWSPVAGAQEYEFQIAADPGFNSPVVGRGKDHVRTKNTRATLTATAPDGTYYWRVRAIGRGGAFSQWSRPRSFSKTWSSRPLPVSPTNAAEIRYPSTPLKLSWSAVPGARKYLVSIATDDHLGSLVPVNGATKPVETTATTLTPAATLAAGEKYYWGVTPVDAEGNLGTPLCDSLVPCPTFIWTWPSQTTPKVTDLVPQFPELYDPQFSWNPVPGAARYEVEISSSKDFASGSKVCCSGTTINTFVTPTILFKSNTYYWRIRAIDMDGHAGVWNCYGDADPLCQHPGSFTKTFDNVPPVTAPSIKNLHMRDNLHDPGIDGDPDPYKTEVPIVTWDPVPGASSYQVDATLHRDGACLWSLTPLAGHWTVTTAVTAWTPLGKGWNQTKPYPDPHPVANDALVPLVRGAYCVRVRARSDRAFGDEVYGDYTYLSDGSGTSEGPAFTWTGYPAGNDCTVSCNPGYLKSSDYVLPETGTITRTTPYFTWKPLRRPWITLKNVSGDDALTLTAGDSWRNDLKVTARDYALDPANDELLLSGSCGLETFRYADDDLVGLADQINARSVCASASGAAAGPLAYVENETLASGITSYFVIVAKDPSFTNIVDYGFTHLPAYAPRGTFGPTTYPDETQETMYYWAVLPEAQWDGTGGAGNPLVAAFQSFHKRSLAPQRVFPDQSHPFFDQPRFQWTPVLGARTYRLQVSQDPSFGNPIEDVITDSTAYSSNTTYPADTVLYWRVRANDENGIGLTWSNAEAPAWTFKKSLAAPVGNPVPTQGDQIPTWSWNVLPGAVAYDVSVDLPDGTHKDFSGFRTPAMTPTLMYGTGVFHWRVRAEFPRSPFGLTPGPYSSAYSFTRTIHAPSGAHADFDRNHVLLSWDAKPGAKRYRVQLSGTEDFAQLVEDVVTDNASYAPLLKFFGFRTLNTGRLFWRVAAIDEGDNLGDFTQPQLIKRTRRMTIAVRGALKRGSKRTLMVFVTDVETGGPVNRAVLRTRGAGTRRRRVGTNAFGGARLVLRPTRRGFLVISASKRGFQGTSVRFRIR
jgi:hypothetical protein